MVISIKKTKEAYALLETYEGNNPYLKRLKYGVFVKKDRTLSDLDIDYIIKNYNHEPEKVNKVIKIAKWFAEKQLDKWDIKFIPEKVLVTDILGETDSVIHVFLKYKQNQVTPCMSFIPKKALLDDIRLEDFSNMIIDFSKYNDVLSKINRKLFEHQESAVKFLLSRKKCLLADDQGLAKTLSSIVASIEGGFNKVLIICPASIKSTWKRELKTFVPEDEIAIINSTNWISGKKYTIINYDIVDLHYKIAKETVITERPLFKKDGTPKLDANGEQLIEIKEKEVKSRKKDLKLKAMSESPMYLEGFDLVIIDEVHKLSNNSSIRYETISDFLHKTGVKNVFLMSGTPMTNKPINLFHVLSLIDHPVCENFEYFVKQYCAGKKITSKTTHKSIWLTDGSSNLDELREKIKNIYLRRLKSDIPGMVEKTIHQRFYDLTNEETEQYNQLWNEYEQAQLELGNENLNRELTEGLFLRQFVSNTMIRNTIDLSNEFLEDGKKVFIACCFNEEIAALKEYFADKAVIYKGGMTIKQKDEAERKFMNDPETTVFIGNIIAAGVGLTLISSHICIFNSYDWVPGNNFQMMDRIHRIGQKEDVQVYFQLFNNTISEHMWETVIRKEMNINKVIKKEYDK